MPPSRRICGHTFLSDLSSDSVVFDLGGNKGEFCHSIIDIYGCRVFCAEPFQENIDRIKPHDRLILFPVAIAGYDGTIRLNISPSHDPSVSIVHDANCLHIDVRCTTLRKLREKAGVSRIDLLKVDIEGAEIEVFQSIEDRELSDIRQITMEFHVFLDPAHKLPAERLISRLSKNFHVIRMSTDDSDIVFLNRRHYSAYDAARLRFVTKHLRGIRRIVRRRLGL